MHRYVYALTLLLLLLALPACHGGWNDGLLTDPDCLAVYNFESGALGTDAKSHLALIVRNAPDANTVNFKQGASSLQLDAAQSECLYAYDANLPSDWPFKNGTSNLTMSVTFWMRPTFIADTPYIFSKHSLYYATKGMRVTLDESSRKITTNQELTPLGNLDDDWPSAMTTKKWYWVCVTWTQVGTVKTITHHVWDDTAGTTLGGLDDQTRSEDSVNNLPVNERKLVIGAVESNPFLKYYSGLLDELTVWNRVLTRDEMDDIRGGTYAYGSGTTNNWWWRRRHGD